MRRFGWFLMDDWPSEKFRSSLVSHKSWFRMFLVCVLVPIGPSGTRGQPRIEETVTVRAQPTEPAQEHAPAAFVNTVEPARYAEELETVADAVGDTVGVSVRRYGGLGAFSTLSIRGSAANQVQVYLDGIPLARAQNEVVNLADLPLDSLERIEVYRGTTPLNFGGAGIGGVVNLVPKQPTESPYAYVSLGYGSFTTRKVTGTWSGKAGGLQWFGNLAYLGSAGNFRFRTDNDTPFNPFDDRTVTRVHNSFDSADWLVRARKDWGAGLRLDLLQEIFWKESDLPGRGANPSLRASAGRLRLLHAARGTASAWPLETVDASGQLFVIFDRSRFSDPLGELGSGQQRREDDSWVLGANALLSTYPAPAHRVSVFAEAGREQFLPHNGVPNAPREPDATRWRTTAALQHQWDLWPNRVQLVPTLRVEWIGDRSESARQDFGRRIPRIHRDAVLWSPGIGLAWRLTEGLSLRSNLGRYERAPNFTELFGNTGAVIGNPELVPERSWNRDVGLAWKGNLPPVQMEIQGEYAYFNNDVERLIVFVQRSAAIFKPENIGRARLRGHELGLRLRWRERWLLDANYTLQDPENRSPALGGIYQGKRLPGRPEQEWYLRTSTSLASFSPYYEFSFTSGNYLDQANFDRVPSRSVHSVGLKCSWGDWDAGIQVRNLTDNQISDVAGFPLPGRAVFVTVAWHSTEAPR
ncbi:MAG: TonB-dependent receptor [Candidatus Binatia bacterium]|nr:MAG: TonB-dependent receptor [Candidatus Binatia bacterium]